MHTCRGCLLAAIATAAVACSRAPSKELPASATPTQSDGGTHAVEDELRRTGYFGGDEASETWREHEAACPGARDGRELVGTTAADWVLSDWIGSEPLTLASLGGRVVVVRFWTAPGCPYCKKTMPALQALSERFADKPVTFIGAFHGKPAASFPDMTEPEAVARAWKVTFPIALDREWKTMKSWWLETGHRHATSVTFVIGPDQKILHVHPGPVFHPSDDPNEAKQNQDYLAVVAAIETGIAATH